MERTLTFWWQETVNEGPQVEMQIDTECSRTTVRKDLIHASQLKPGRQQATVASEDVVSYELADITAEVDGQKIPIEAAVADKLPVQVLLGSDLPLEKLIVRRISVENLLSAPSSG